MNTLSRRTFVASIGATAVTPPGILRAADAVREHLTGAMNRDKTYVFFDVAEARFIEAACARLIPPDDTPSADGVHVALYLDAQLAGPWGAGHQPYRAGPWQPGAAASGVLASSPARVFRTALGAINRGLAARGKPFDALDATNQEFFLRGLRNGAVALDGVPAAAFFALLLALTMEGFFSKSAHARQHHVIAWPLQGFPGGYFRAADAAEGRGATKPAARSHSQR